MGLQRILKKGAKKLGIEISPKEAGLFLKYLEEINLWNEKINITAIRNNEEIIINHFLDSLTLLEFIPERSKVLDIGSGGGFPGIPLKIVRPSLDVTLLDASQKKIFFMKSVIRKLGLKGIGAIQGRAEDLENNVPRKAFDRVVSRAVGKIRVLFMWSIPYVKKEGKVLLMRGKKGMKEWKELEEKGNRNFILIEYKELLLPFSGHERVILGVTVQKP